MNRSIEEAIVYWHRRYYGPMTIAPLVGQSVSDVQAVIYRYETEAGKVRH